MMEAPLAQTPNVEIHSVLVAVKVAQVHVVCADLADVLIVPLLRIFEIKET
jgi:hypothetical protein